MADDTTQPVMAADVGRNVGRSCRPIPVRLYAAHADIGVRAAVC